MTVMSTLNVLIKQMDTPVFVMMALKGMERHAPKRSPCLTNVWTAARIIVMLMQYVPIHQTVTRAHAKMASPETEELVHRHVLITELNVRDGLKPVTAKMTQPLHRTNGSTLTASSVAVDVDVTTIRSRARKLATARDEGEGILHTAEIQKLHGAVMYQKLWFLH